MQKKLRLNTRAGITLIALVVTIIVLLILATVSINLVVGENGVITKATESAFRTDLKQKKEQMDLDSLGQQIEGEEQIAESFSLEPILKEDADEWKITLKNELICWGNYDLQISDLTANYIKENFIDIIGTDPMII